MADSKASNSLFAKSSKESENFLTSFINVANTNFITIAHPNEFSYILKKTGNCLLVVEFFAKWCGPCQVLSPKLEELAKSYDGRILIVKIDVDEFVELVAEFNILATPTFIIMKNKKRLQQFFSSDVQTLGKNLEKYVGKPIRRDNR